MPDKQEIGLTRDFRIERAKISDKKRTVELAFSSETPVERWGENEVLSHERGHYDLSRLNGRHPLLLGHDEHDPKSQIGVVESARVDSDKVGRAVVRFGNSALASEIFQDVKDGIRELVSFGYDHKGVVSRDKDSNGKQTTRYKWMPTHIAIVTVPADTRVGIGRSQTKERSFSMNNENETEIVALQKAVTHDWPHLTEKIKEACLRARAENTPMQDFKRGLMDLVQKYPAPPNQLTRVMPGEIGMEQRDINSYSFTRAFKSAMENGGIPKNCPEADIHQQTERSSEYKSGAGFLVPAEVSLGMSRRDYFQRRILQRDMQAEIFPLGGAFVPTEVPMSIVQLLRNKMIVQRLGCTSMSGLSGNAALPRQVAANVAQSISEIGQLVESDPIVDQVPLNPHRVGATTTFSKQLIIQSAPDAESFIRDDLGKVVAIKHDYLGLNGSGSGDEPLGILNTPGIGSILFGATATYQKLVAFETNLGLANADDGRLAYATTPANKGAWRGIAVALTGATTVSSRALWEGGNYPGSNDGNVADYRAASTNQILNNLVIFGNWLELVWANWGGLDIVMDIYTLAKKAEVVVTINTWLDFALLHPQSFCVSADAGNQ